jgi:probable F420-dependent oxidoreductase
MKIRFAVTPPSFALQPDIFPDYAEACEAMGFDTLWLSDIPLGPNGDPLLSLTFAAARTRRLKLGANVVPLGRNPLWLAKQLAQLDQLSGGRLLLSFVPGLGALQERAALGHQQGDRGHAIDETIALLRQWWAGAPVSARFREFTYNEITVLPRPQQQPLEIWLADGWLTASATPEEAHQGRLTIEARAEALGRRIDPEHFGISIPYAQAQPQPAALAALRARRADRDLSRILPLGSSALIELVQAHIAGGITKFVLRSLSDSPDWRADLAWLAESVLPLQR